MSLQYFDDDGTEMNPDFIKMPSLCTVCKLKDDPNEEMLCNLNRLDQANDDEFFCDAYVSLDGNKQSDEDDVILF